MKIHTNEFKNKLKEEKEMKIKIFVYNGGLGEGGYYIEDDKIFNLNQNFNTDLLKSVMKEVDFESTIKIDVGKKFDLSIGILVGDSYEYIGKGMYIIKTCNYDVATKRYIYKCYDLMFLTMIDYDSTGITFPIYVDDFLDNIAKECGLNGFSSQKETANLAKTIKKDYFQGYNYTFRDVLDYLAQILGGWLYVDDEYNLRLKYPTETNEVFDEKYIRNINVQFLKKYGPVNSVVFSRSNGTDNIYRKDDNSIAGNGLCEIKISDNPILDDEDREIFIDAVFEELNGLEFYIMDVDTIGILFLDLGDKYSFKVTDDSNEQQMRNYKCLLMNAEIKTIDGLTETHFNREPEISVTDYKTSAPTDKSIKNALIKVDKNAAEIVLKANADGKIVQVKLEAGAEDGSIFDIKADNINLEGYTSINDSFKIDQNGSMFVDSNITWERNYTQEDVNILQQILVDGTTPTKAQLEYYDANGNGILDINDLLLVQKVVLGTNPSTRVGKLKINSYDGYNTFVIYDETNDKNGVRFGIDGGFIKNLNSENFLISGNPIIESGSNDNGEYVKFYDGTMICRKTCTGSADINKSWGTMYDTGDGTGELISLGDYPKPFVGKRPQMLPLFAGANSCFVASIRHQSNSFVGHIILASPRSKSVNYTIDIIAIGRWKQ